MIKNDVLEMITMFYSFLWGIYFLKEIHSIFFRGRNYSICDFFNVHLSGTAPDSVFDLIQKVF